MSEMDVVGHGDDGVRTDDGFVGVAGASWVVDEVLEEVWAAAVGDAAGVG